MDTTGNNALKPDENFTLEDWKAWPEGERWELIHGEAFAMSPAPRLKHQRLLLKLSTQLASRLKGKSCEPFISPVDVFLAENVVQPDLMIVCDPEKCRDEGIFGPPDWILEILSPSTSYKDQTQKRNLYEQFGVKEYWILNPDTLDLIIYYLEGDKFSNPVGFRLDKPVAVKLFPGIELTLAD